MRLLDLRLRAYGPFTDRHLDLSAGREGLHLIYGRNEAGKSSALRALKALLFGVPVRTQDDFLHDKPVMRVGARLRDGDGNELVCYRRKGSKNTLLDAADQPIADEALAGFLHGVDERLFERLFGIDHPSLVSGGQALLAERGREAETLFGTGLGSTRIHAVLAALDQEAAALFAPRASKPQINTTLGQLAETQKRLREVSLSAREWEAAREDLEQAGARLAALDEQLAAAGRRRGTLERIRRTLPGLAQRAQIGARLAELSTVPVLDAGFTPRREEAAAKRLLAGAGQLKAAARLAALREQAATLAVAADLPTDLTTEAPAIAALREQLGSHRKAALDRPALAVTVDARQAQARHRLAAIRPGLALTDCDRLRPLLTRRGRATELGGRQGALEARVKGTRDALTQTALDLAARQTELAGLTQGPPLDALARAVAAARRAGDLDQAIAQAGGQRQRHAEACARDLGALGLWTGDLAALRAAALPGQETLRRFDADELALDEEARRLALADTEAQAERRRTLEALRALELAGTVPAEADLLAARAHRDQGWRLLKRHWLDGADVSAETERYTPDAPLPAAFEGAVTASDELADRLRREAQRVHDHAAARARLEAVDRTLAETAAAGAHLTGRRAALAAAWQQVWTCCGLSPRTPREMADWTGKASRLRDKAAQGDEIDERLAALRETRETLKGGLAAALATFAAPDPTPDPAPAARVPELAPLLDRAESHLRALEAAERRREALATAVAELDGRRQHLELEAASAATEHADWQVAWGALMRELGLRPDATPGEVADDLQAIADILQLVDEAAGLQSRVAGIDTDARVFAEATRGLLTRLAPDLLGRPLEEAVPELHRRLGEQREAKSRLAELITQATQAEQEVQTAQVDLQAADAVLASLCRQAGCDRPEDLPAIEERARQRAELSAALHRLETELIEGGDGLGLAALAQEAAAVDRDAVMTELDGLQARLAHELQPQREALLAHRINAERDFALMAGSDAAAALAEESEQTLAALRAQAERYVRVRLAARVLRDAIEGFRRQHRDPILARAGGHFAQLTGQAFAAVETDFDDADQSVFVGVRAGGARLRVEGMSTGTRDQLYLALRLATLEHYLDGAPPLPFIIDDILIQFDDERARATLAALADFSARTQVILFTHHRRVVEQALALDGAEERVFVHELG